MSEQVCSCFTLDWLIKKQCVKIFHRETKCIVMHTQMTLTLPRSSKQAAHVCLEWVQAITLNMIVITTKMGDDFACEDSQFSECTACGVFHRLPFMLQRGQKIHCKQAKTANSIDARIGWEFPPRFMYAPDQWWRLCRRSLSTQQPPCTHRSQPQGHQRWRGKWERWPLALRLCSMEKTETCGDQLWNQSETWRFNQEGEILHLLQF